MKHPKLHPSPPKSPAPAKPVVPWGDDTGYVDKPSGSITVTFTGDPSGGRDPDNPEYGGVPMPKGVPVVIKDPAWIKQYGARLRRNSHFRVE